MDNKRLFEIARELRALGFKKTSAKLSNILRRFSARGVAVWDDETCPEYDEEKYDKYHDLAQTIAQEIENMRAQEEQGRWAREDDDWVRSHDPEMLPSYLDEGQLSWREIQMEMDHQVREAKLDYLYDKLSEMCFRLERPYEHWGEEEGYRAYQERDRDYGDY